MPQSTWCACRSSPSIFFHGRVQRSEYASATKVLLAISTVVKGRLAALAGFLDTLSMTWQSPQCPHQFRATRHTSEQGISLSSCQGELCGAVVKQLCDLAVATQLWNPTVSRLGVLRALLTSGNMQGVTNLMDLTNCP